MSDATDVAPKQRALSAAENAVADLEEANREHDNAAKIGMRESEVVETFSEEVAAALVDGLNDSVGFYASMLADAATYYTKTDLKQKIKTKVEKQKNKGQTPLGEFITERLEKVTVVRTTDHRQGAEYIWNFGNFKVETRSGKDGRGHFLYGNFRDLIHESGGVNTAPPTEDRRDGEDWRDFMVGIIDERGETVETRGPRTKAVEALQNKITRLTGYGTAESALDHTGLWVLPERYEVPEWFAMGQPFSYTRPAPVDIPDWWAGPGARSVQKQPPEWYGAGEIDPHPPGQDRGLPDDTVSEVRVHESLIEPILEDAEITRSALYHELNARGHTIPGTSGASMTEWVNGSDQRFWTLLPSIGTPRRYVPDPNAGVVRIPGESATDDEDASAEQTQDQEQSEVDPAETGGSDAQDDSDGFDSVGDIA